MELPRHIDLPSGGTVNFGDVEDLTGDDHRHIISQVSMPEDGKEIGAAMDVAYGTACMLIESWNIPYTPKGTVHEPGAVPIPTTDMTLLGRLKFRDYHTIINAIGPAVALLFPSPPSPDQAQVPGSPTVPAGG